MANKRILLAIGELFNAVAEGPDTRNVLTIHGDVTISDPECRVDIGDVDVVVKERLDLKGGTLSSGVNEEAPAPKPKRKRIKSKVKYKKRKAKKKVGSPKKKKLGRPKKTNLN